MKTYLYKSISASSVITVTLAELGIYGVGAKKIMVATNSDDAGSGDEILPTPNVKYGMQTYEFMPINGKLPNLFKFQNNTSSAKRLHLLICDVGGEGDENYFKGIGVPNGKMAMSMSLLDEEPTMIKDISKDEIN